MQKLEYFEFLLQQLGGYSRAPAAGKTPALPGKSPACTVVENLVTVAKDFPFVVKNWAQIADGLVNLVSAQYYIEHCDSDRKLEDKDFLEDMNTTVEERCCEATHLETDLKVERKTE